MTAYSLLECPPDGFQLARFREVQAAKDWADSRLKTAPNDTDVLYLKAWLDHTTRDTDDCFEKTSRLIALKSHLGFAYKLRSEALVRRKDYTKALVDINQAIKLMPHESTLFTVRSSIYKALGKTEEAANDKKLCSLLRRLYSAWIQVVAQDFESTLKASPDRSPKFSVNFIAGQKAFDRNEFVAAAEYFTRAIKLKPDCPELYLYRGACYETTDQWKRAIADYSYLAALGENTVIPLHVAPSNESKIEFDKWPSVSVPMAEAFKRRARCYCFLNDHKVALQDMNVAVKQEPEDRWTVEFRGSVLTSSKQFKQAVNDYVRAEILEPTYMNAGPKLIVCLKQSGDHAQAVRRLSWVLKRNPGDEELLLSRADSLSKLGFHNEAIKDLTSVIKSEPELLESYLCRAKEYEKLGLFKSALSDYDAVISLDKEHTERSTKASDGKQRVLKQIK